MKDGVMRLARLALATGLLLASAVAARAFDPGEFASVERMVERTYPDVAHIGTAELERLVRQGEALLILDVREAAEYRVSRIPGALRVDPGIWTRRLIAELGTRAQGKTVVLYCSVGVRSAKLAGRAQSGLMAAGARQVVNLMGGIFRWHNELRALEGETGPAGEVHPYDARWGRLLQRQHMARDTPAGG